MIFILIIRASGWDHQVEHQGPQSYRSKSRTVGEKKFSAAVVRPLITLRFVAPYSVEHAISPPNRGLLISTSARPYCITPSIRLKKKVHTASRTLFFFFPPRRRPPGIYSYLSISTPSPREWYIHYGIIAFWIISISTSSWEIFLKNRNLRISQKRVILKKSTLEKKKRGENPRFVCNGKSEKNNECLWKEVSRFVTSTVSRRLIDCPSLRVWKNELFGVDAQIIACSTRYAKLPSNRRPMRPKMEW